MPARSAGIEKLPSDAEYVCVETKSWRLRAMMRALPTGCAALVTVPRTCRTAGSGAAGWAGAAMVTDMRPARAAARAVARNRRISLLRWIPCNSGLQKTHPALLPLDLLSGIVHLFGYGRFSRN